MPPILVYRRAFGNDRDGDAMDPINLNPLQIPLIWKSLFEPRTSKKARKALPPEAVAGQSLRPVHIDVSRDVAIGTPGGRHAPRRHESPPL